MLVSSCNSQNISIVDPISPIKVSFKDNGDKIQICYPLVETKAIASIKLKINRELKITSINLTDMRYKTDDNKIHEIEDKDKLVQFFNSKKFIDRISINLVNKKFNDFPYSTVVSFPVFLKNCNN
jgi:hypothetical protein